MQGIKILLVDDERDFVQTLAERLALRGMDVSLAFDGLTALDSISRSKPHMVVLDLYMPGMTGDEVLRHIKHRHPDLPVILLTGHCAGEEQDAGPLAQAYTCLTKPLALPALLEHIRNALAHSPSCTTCVAGVPHPEETPHDQ